MKNTKSFFVDSFFFENKSSAQVKLLETELGLQKLDAQLKKTESENLL